MPVVRMHQQGTIRYRRNCFERRARKQREASGIIGVIRTSFDINSLSIEVRRVIDEDHIGSALPVGIAEKADLLPPWPDVNSDLASDLLEVLRDTAYSAIQGNDNEHAHPLAYLHIGKSLNCLRQSARSRIRSELGRYVSNGNRLTRCGAKRIRLLLSGTSSCSWQVDQEVGGSSGVVLSVIEGT